MLPAATLQGLIDTWAGWGSRPAIVALRDPAPEIWNYDRLALTARRLAAGLLRAGLGPAEPVVLLGPASPQWLACCFGVTAAGGIAVPLDPQLPEEEAARLLLDTQCRRVFAAGRQANRLATTRAVRDSQLWLLDGQLEGLAPPWTALLDESLSPLPTLAPEAPAILLYTSGTTGAPKGVPLSHANLLANLAALQAEALVSADDRVLVPLPLHHAYPFAVGVLGALSSGATLLLPADTSGPALARALGDATVLVGVPRLHATLLDAFAARLSPWQRRLIALCVKSQRSLRLPIGRWLLAPLRRAVAPGLRLVVSGGAKLDETVEWTLMAIGWQVLTGYGLTETSPMLTFNLPGKSRVGSAGRPLPNVALRIANPDKDGFGEIQAKGPNVFSGYWHRPALTEAAFAADGWLRTGDLGRLDDSGYLYVASRTQELIVLPSGEKVLPEEVESVYERSPIIREIAVLEQGGVLVALVVPDEQRLRGGTLRIEGQLRDDIERLNEQLRPFQRVARIAVTRERLPRTPIGKLQRFRLPTLWQRATTARPKPRPLELTMADQQLLADPTARAVWDWLRTRFGDRAYGLEASPQLDLGVDSLAWLGLTLEIEDRFGRSLGEDAVNRVVTLRDLLREVVDAPPATSIAAQAPVIKPAGAMLSALGLLLYLIDRAIFALCFPLRIEGRESLPVSGPFVLVPNHSSYLDPPALAAALPLRLLPEVHWAGWAELLFATALRRLASRATQVFPVDPRRGGWVGIASAEALLAQGRIVVWFPEGRRSPDGRLQAFTPGIGRLIARTGVPAVPVRIEGSFVAWPRWRRLPRPHRIAVAFGRPIERAALAPEGDSDEIYRRIAERLHRAVADLGAPAMERSS
jgi:long-chain acyl-CoA synthetase